MKKINPVLLNNYASFAEWEAAVNAIPDPVEKGNAMEYLTYFYLKSNDVYYDIKEIYMEDAIPEKLRASLRLERKDNGVDGVIVRGDGKTIAYQVKFRSGRAVPSASELATFWAESEYADMRLIAANCASLPKVANKKKNQMSLLIDTFMTLDSGFFSAFLDFLNGRQTAPVYEKHTPRLYQRTLIAEILDGFSKNDRGKLIAACGTGKTEIALWVHEEMGASLILYVVPSLALIRQTLESWSRNRTVPFHFLCVCSDNTVAGEISEDELILSPSDVDFPVTTSPDDIRSFLQADGDFKKIIFSTYNSLDAVSNAMLSDGNLRFDLAVFDESHRTAGTKDSLMFVYGMDDKYIPVEKRLFMTATERLVSPHLKDAAFETETVVFSMDDASTYGPTFSSLNFGQAITQKIIADYRIVLCTVTEDDIADMIQKRKIVTAELGEASVSSDINVLLKQALLAKAMKELKIKKVISYHSLVKSARAFITGTGAVLPAGEVIDEIIGDTANQETYTNHVNGTMSAGVRKEILTAFEQSKRGLISNAKCLTEGVDVPAIDAVYFADPKNSMVDIVQAVGRALRKPDGQEDKCAYIIVPLIIPKEASLFSHIAPSEFDTLHMVIQAMRSQDDTLADIIDTINFSAAAGSLGTARKALNSKVIVMPYSKLNITDFENSLSLRIAEVNKNPASSARNLWTENKRLARKSEMKRVFTSIGDYTLDAYLNSLLLPTLKKFSSPSALASRDDIKCNHNNVSHAVKIGAVEKCRKQYRMTPVGAAILNDPDCFSSLAKEQLLKYYCYNKEDGCYLFPYRAILKIFLQFDYITRFEFLYCVYSLRSTSDRAVDRAAERIRYLRFTYPNIHILNDANKEKVLNTLNTKFDVRFGYKDIWTSRTTTYNQFNYFKKHLWAFENIFVTSETGPDKEKIRIYPGAGAAISELLSITADIEKAADAGNETLLEELYTKQMCPPL